jgi:hypothetical protein
VSARQAFERAQAAAHDWQGDAGLTSLSANWSAARRDDLTGGPRSWSVAFYSPSAGQRRNFTLSSGSPRASEPERPPGLPPIIDLSQWQIDSQQALALFLEHGGGEFIDAHQPVSVSLVLATSENGRLQWIVVALDPATSEVHGVAIDAATGAVE